jgi:hypothetical protein
MTRKPASFNQANEGSDWGSNMLDAWYEVLRESAKGEFCGRTNRNTSKYVSLLCLGVCGIAEGQALSPAHYRQLCLAIDVLSM